MALNDYYRASVIWSNPLADGEVVNVFDYQLTELGAPGTEIQLCGRLAFRLGQLIETLWLNDLTTSWTLVETRVFNITQPQYSGGATFGSPGEVVGEACPLRIATVVHKSTGLRGRSYNGRTFLPSPPQAQQTEGVLDAGYIASIETDYDAILNPLTADGDRFILQVYSETLGLGNPVVAFAVRSRLGSVKGRQVVSS